MSVLLETLSDSFSSYFSNSSSATRAPGHSFKNHLYTKDFLIYSTSLRVLNFTPLEQTALMYYILTYPINYG